MGILVTIHEWGHYAVARFFNIKVVDFSIGFGKAIFSFKRGETNFKVAMIPLGGFVKFLDERDGTSVMNPKEDYSRAFNRQSVFVRFAVVIAGPLVNLIFAWMIFSLIYFSGVSGVKPVFAKATDSSPLSIMAGNIQEPRQITNINDKKVNTWREVEQQVLLSLINKSPLITVTTKSFLDSSRVNKFEISLTNLDINSPKQNRIRELGFVPDLPTLPAVLGNISPNSPANKSGFIVGDKILAVDGVAIKSWSSFVKLVRKSPNKLLQVKFYRKEIIGTTSLIISSREYASQEIGYFGASVFFDEQVYQPYRSKSNYSFVDSIKLGYEHGFDMVKMTLVMLKRMVIGEVDVSNLSGPISIADYSGKALQLGWVSFLSLLGLLSLSLGILNLLPIPVLDGGNLVLYIVEIVKGTPLKARYEVFLQQFGVLLIFSLTFFAIFNDVVRISNG